LGFQARQVSIPVFSIFELDFLKMDMSKFTSAMLDAIEHCASVAQIDVEWRSVSVGDMRDAYDPLNAQACARWR
jgi:hypothetical protein